MDLYFKANNPSEEYAIVDRFLCPTCKGKIRVRRQELMMTETGKIKGDHLTCQCKKCQSEIMLTFYLPPNYEPLKEIQKRFKR